MLVRILWNLIRDLPLVVRSHCYSFVDGHEHIRLYELALAQYSNRCAESIQESSVLSQLLKFDLGHGHQRIDLMLRALEVLYAECVDGDDLDTRFVAYFEDLATC